MRTKFPWKVIELFFIHRKNPCFCSFFQQIIRALKRTRPGNIAVFGIRHYLRIGIAKLSWLNPFRASCSWWEWCLLKLCKTTSSQFHFAISTSTRLPPSPLSLSQPTTKSWAISGRFSLHGKTIHYWARLTLTSLIVTPSVVNRVSLYYCFMCHFPPPVPPPHHSGLRPGLHT